MKKAIITIAVLAAAVSYGQNKPYITKVYEFMPAPGQFVNASPKFTAGEPVDSVLARVSQALCGRETVEEVELPDGTIVLDTTTTVKPGLVSLGSFGGYVVFGFDHPVVNVAGELDFQVFGNAFQANQSSTSGGSSEPGIVMVSRDSNGNGVPDDPWYELAGSEYDNPRTQKHFTITYYKPDENKPAVPVPPFITDAEHVRWTCNSVDSLQEGYVSRNSFHAQSYWPGWAEGETLTFTGTKLPCNASDESANHDGSYWVQRFYDWGYVDNRPDYGYGYDGSTLKDNQNMGFNIEWAVDDSGTPVRLNKVDFIKVYNGVLQYCGWLGETSTEVCGGIDLHPDAVAEPDPAINGDLNADGVVDVEDMNIIINIILNKLQDPDVKAQADINSDGVVDVEDMNTVINIILHKVVM